MNAYESLAGYLGEPVWQFGYSGFSVDPSTVYKDNAGGIGFLAEYYWYDFMIASNKSKNLDFIFDLNYDPSSGGDPYRYGSPESDILWLISASGAVLTKTKEAQRTIETGYRLNQLKPYSVDINTGKVLWENPSLLKWSRWAGFANTTGDLFNAVGILYNVFWRGEGLNTTNTLDGIFGAIGFIPIYGDAAALWYMGIKALVKTEGYQNASKVWYEYGFSPSFRHCFVEGSKIALDNRTVKNIEDIQVDDSVLTYNFTNGH